MLFRSHDNNTVNGWYNEINEHDRQMFIEYSNKLDAEEPANWDMICLAMRSVADTCIIPIQDFLGLDESARINAPSTLGYNWKWRMKEGSISEELIKKIRRLTKIYGRL